MNESLKNLIKRHEGLKLFPYRCSAGKLTIGFGRNLDDNGISLEEANFLLDRDIQLAVQDTMSVFPSFYAYPEEKQCALIDMMFNLGLPKFLNFKKMIKAVKEMDWNEAARQAEDSRWYLQVGKRGRDIVSMLKE
ncbi:MAG: glycoside hydrolase family protein [Dehalococcoidia bacterium]|nr:glycoside hydrolase family protein [Dehalococcoidia bacterium]